MDVRVGSALILALVGLSTTARAAEFHESLQAGVVCSAENNPLKFEILETPVHEDGFFKVSEGLCRALAVDPDEGSTLIPVALCMDSRGAEFTLLYGGWLNMLTVKFREDTGSQDDLICR
jgi:hypothetical protein